MKWATVKLIFCREVCDQLRDRRTLFTVAVLPLLLYPLMGMALLQVAQFMREHPTKVWIIGSENLPTDLPLIEGERIADAWMGDIRQDLVQLQSTNSDEQFYAIINEFRNPDSKNQAGADLVDQMLQQEMRKRDVDLAVFIPTQLGSPRDHSEGEHALEDAPHSPLIYLFVNSASDKSNIAMERFNAILTSWQQAIAHRILEENNISVSMVTPFKIAKADVANQNEKQAALWSKILPFIIMIWSLTGAFYPAVDLCAGEKERGTFETLLSSPAHRTDLAIGKLLTVMAFSMTTSMLNLLSMGFTGMFVFSRLGGVAAAIGPPPLAAIGWLFLALIPISALFSAMALAAAAFARSSKEGQYYLIPLMMICMPLMMIPMLPAARLDLGTSLIPISGLMLLLRGLIEGKYSEVLQFAAPVCAVTLICCWLAINWVVKQFNSETVLFRASERFGIGVWFKQVMNERHQLPSLGNAVLCALVILVVKFFVGFAAEAPDTWSMFAKQTIVILVATVAMPALLMAIVLTRNPMRSLRLKLCRLPVAAAAILAAIFLHPLVMWLTTLVMHIYPPAGDLIALQEVVNRILGDAPNIWAILLVFAVVPAIIEELAYRGFILSGFQAVRNGWTAVLLTSFCFGLAHGILQQSIITFFIGIILGWIAVRSNSLIPCVLYHAVHNGLTVVCSTLTPTVVEDSVLLRTFMETTNGSTYQYSIGPGIVMSVLGVLLLTWLLTDSNHNRPSESDRFAFPDVLARLRLSRVRNTSK